MAASSDLVSSATTSSPREHPDSYAPYNPAETEAHWYDFWVKHDLFRPESHPNFGKRPPFVITMPPPNVTGGLHNGHTLFVTLEDIMIRWHRMLCDPSLWVPGRDHAGIAGQLVVERLQARGWHFYNFFEPGVYRLMCSWATTEEEIAQFAADLA